MEKNKLSLRLFGFVVLIIASLSIAYYFLYSLPNYNNQKLNLQREKQEEEIRLQRERAENERVIQDRENSIRETELAKKIQDDCIESTQNSVASYFDKTNATFSPLFYPYEDESSFNRNERLLTSLSTYQSCIYNDPRYDYNNLAIKSILNEAEMAEVSINNFMFEYKEKTPELCESYLLTTSAKQKCELLEKHEYDFGFGI